MYDVTIKQGIDSIKIKTGTRDAIFELLALIMDPADDVTFIITKEPKPHPLTNSVKPAETAKLEALENPKLDLSFANLLNKK